MSLRRDKDRLRVYYNGNVDKILQNRVVYNFINSILHAMAVKAAFFINWSQINEMLIQTSSQT